jgi:hypothetical protein
MHMFSCFHIRCDVGDVEGFPANRNDFAPDGSRVGHDASRAYGVFRQSPRKPPTTFLSPAILRVATAHQIQLA